MPHVHVHLHRTRDEVKHDPSTGQFAAGSGGGSHSQISVHSPEGERRASQTRKSLGLGLLKKNLTPTEHVTEANYHKQMAKNSAKISQKHDELNNTAKAIAAHKIARQHGELAQYHEIMSKK